MSEKTGKIKRAKMSEKTGNTKSWKNVESVVIIFFFIILFVVLAYISMSAPIHRWADSSTYYLQISSIVNDHDIQYQPIDIQRALLNKFDDLPTGLLLIKTDDGNYFYGKEFSYALLASPFFALLGNHGILFFNALMFWLMILIGFFYLSKKGNSQILSFFTSLIFFILSTALVYLFWIHVEIYNMFLITIGIYFGSLYIDDQKKEKYLILSALIFGLATVAKLPNFLLFLPFLCYVLYTQQFKRAISVLLIFLIPILFIYGFFYLETGSISFYGGDRLYYSFEYPFIDGYNNFNEIGQPAFSVEEGRISALITTDVLTKSPHNLFYYFFGRFTGMIWYYPLTVFALVSFVIGLVYIKKQKIENSSILSILKKNPTQYLVFIGIILNILFYIIIIGNNYLGGQHAIGNRYFYIFPAFLFLIAKIDLKVIIPFIIVALFTVFPVISDPVGTSQRPENHTFRSPYTFFPVEYSQINNLPLWTRTYISSDYSIYDIDGNGIFSFNQNFNIMNGTSHWLIKTKPKDQNLPLIIFTTDENKMQVVISSESQSSDITVNNANAELVTFPLTRAVYEDAGYRLYSLKIKSSPGVFVIPLNENWKNESNVQYLSGWNNKERWNNIPTTWSSGNATFMVFSDYSQNRSLNLKAVSYRSQKNLNILFQKKVILNTTVSSIKLNQIQVPISLQKGANIIQLYVPEGCERPIDIPELNSADARCLSVAIQNITLF